MYVSRKITGVTFSKAPLTFYGIYLWTLHEIFEISGKSNKNNVKIIRTPVKSIGISRNISEGGGGNYKGGFENGTQVHPVFSSVKRRRVLRSGRAFCFRI